MYAGCIGYRRRRPGIEMSPDASRETEDAKQHKCTAARHSQPMRQEACQERLGADAACHRDKTRAHPRGIGSFRSEHRAGAASSVPRSALSLTRAVLRSMADALSFMRTALSLSFSLFSTIFV